MKHYTLDEWIIYGHTGTSSKTMWAALKGIVGEDRRKGWCFDIPYDFADFSRCLMLYRQCQLTKEDLAKVGETFKWWQPIIDSWDMLTELHDKKDWQYKVFYPLRDRAMVLDGWVETGEGCWQRKEQSHA